MPKLPLYIPPAATADAWHRVTAPGGYEGWHFEAEDAASDMRIVGALHEGFPFHQKYLRRYARYRRWPTRFAPPLPGEYPCCCFAVYRGGKVAWKCTVQGARGEYEASDAAADVRLGASRLWPEADGSLRLHLEGVPCRSTWHGPTPLDGAKLVADFVFQPRLAQPPYECTFLSREVSGATHQWVIANPLCDVSGHIRVIGTAADVETENRVGDGFLGEPKPGRGRFSSGGGISSRGPSPQPSPLSKGERGPEDAGLPFTGRGYHDHIYGTGPLGPGLRVWMRGHILLADRAWMFQFAKARDRRLPDEIHLVEADASGMRERAIKEVEADWSCRTKLLLAYPSRMRFGDALTLERPRVIEAGVFRVRLIYQATVGGQAATALCEIAYPHRLRWPMLGRMMV